MKSVPVEKIVRGIELFNDDFVFFGMLLYYNIYILYSGVLKYFRKVDFERRFWKFIHFSSNFYHFFNGIIILFRVVWLISDRSWPNSLCIACKVLMYAFGDAFEESKRKLVWKNVDGNLSGYEQFKLDKLSSYRNGSSNNKTNFSGVLSEEPSVYKFPYALKRTNVGTKVSKNFSNVPRCTYVYKRV